MTDKISPLRFGSICTKSERTDKMFRPDERKASPEALICLKCPLPVKECKPDVCKRYKEEKLKIKNNIGGIK